MTKVPSLSGKQVISALHKAGFKVIRQKGSHVFLRHNDGRTTVVPVHSGETFGPGLLHKIISDADMNREEFIKLLKK